MDHSIYSVTPMKIAFAISLFSAGFSALSTSCMIAVVGYSQSSLASTILAVGMSPFLLFNFFNLFFKATNKAAIKGNGLKYVPSLASNAASLVSSIAMAILMPMATGGYPGFMRLGVITCTLASIGFTGFMFVAFMIIHQDKNGHMNKNILSTPRDERSELSPLLKKKSKE